MTVNVKLQNGGLGKNVTAEVTRERALLVTQLLDPPLIPQNSRPFSQYLTDDGTSSGSNDMGVDGSSTNQEFYLQADSDEDTYIRRLSIIVGYGGSAGPYQFADSTALTNGIRLYYTSLYGEQDISNLKTNSDFLQEANIGIVPTAWEIRSLGALNDYGYLINIDLTTLSPGLGIKLDRTTLQSLRVTIRDNCTNADTFNMKAFGFKRRPSREVDIG